MQQIIKVKKKPHLNKLDVHSSSNLNRYPHENFFRHPAVLKSTVSGAVLAGLIVAVIAWLLSSGAIGSEDLSFTSPGILIAIGFITGGAIGGLIGNVYGIFLMLKKRG